MERQTAVEFLITQISKDTLGKSFIATWKQEFEQAKQIEKEQIVEAFYKGVDQESDTHGAMNLDRIDADMTPKEKAQELYQKFSDQIPANTCGDISEFIVVYERVTKKCALILVDEIIKSRKEDKSFNDYLSSTGSEYYTPHPMYLTYWKEVKQELEKLKN